METENCDPNAHLHYKLSLAEFYIYAISFSRRRFIDPLSVGVRVCGNMGPSADDTLIKGQSAVD